MATGGSRQPWEQQPDESSAAFAAFGIYRDMGAARSVCDAYRQRTGKAEAKQASGVWNGWAKRFDWAARAQAWDRHQAAIRQKAIERATASSAERWLRRRDEGLEKAWEVGKRLLDQANLLAHFPVVDTEKADGGAVTRISAVPPATLRAAALVARDAAELMRVTTEAALGPGDERAPTPAPAPPQDEVQLESQRRVEAFRALMRSRMLTMPSGPPGDDDEDGPERNGAGPL